jgi:hypothetical protein
VNPGTNAIEQKMHRLLQHSRSEGAAESALFVKERNETEMKAKSKTVGYVVNCIAVTVLMLSAQISLAASATWLSTPEDSAWENPSNWTPGGPPNGPSDIATFDRSSQTGVNISTPEEVNSIVFTSNAASYDFSVLGCSDVSCGWGELIISGVGITTNNNVWQRNFGTANAGQIIFNNASTAGSVSINNSSQNPASIWGPGYTIFNDASSAAGASIYNGGSPGPLIYGGPPGATIFNGTSTAGHATITNGGGSFWGGGGGTTTFTNSSTAESATLVANVGFSSGGGIDFYDASSAGNAIIIANGATYDSGGGAIHFHDGSTGGTARVEVFDNGDLDITDHQSGVMIGSIEGSGNISLRANNLTVGTNNIDTSFSGMISNDDQGGSLAKIGSGVLTLQTNDCIADTVGLILVSGSIIKLDFTGPPDVIASLVVNGVPQPPGIYGGPTSGAPNILPEFAGSGTVSVGLDQRRRYDFNGDGHPDYVLYNPSTHRTAIWYLNNSDYVGGAYGPTLPAGWTLVDTGDFNGDGSPDYAPYNAGTRRTAIWYLNNNVYVSSGYGPTPPSGWQLVATADFNGDGNPDYVLYSPATRQTAIWYLNNNVYVSGAYGPSLPVGWSLVGSADFNGDRKTDYLLFNSATRQSAIWYLNNNVYVSGVFGPTLPSGWQLRGTADFNGNSKPDYVLYKASTRQTAIWYLNNNVYVSGASGPTLTAGWSLIAP